MSKVLVLYYSAYGHIEALANAVAEGARETGAKVDVKRVPETVPAEIAKAHHFKLDQAAPIATIDDLANYDDIVIGTGTRFGRISSQMATFLDQAGQPVDARRAAREGGRRVQRLGHAARRPGGDALQHHRQHAAFRHADRRPRLWSHRSDDS
jgi:NAD(P)H:quinone oxidoreductase type IV